jgi:hypothetical protein
MDDAEKAGRPPDGTPPGPSGCVGAMKRLLVPGRAALLTLLLALIGSEVAAAPEAAPAPGDAAAMASFDRFARQIGPFCMVGPSSACFMRSFDFADAGHDGTLALDEVQRMQGLVRDWTLANQSKLAPQDRRSVLLGLLVLQIVGLDQLFASYDADHDGKLTPAELSADIKLDDRPLPKLLQDSRAIDWPRLEARLGPAAVLVGGLRPPAG